MADIQSIGPRLVPAVDEIVRTDPADRRNRAVGPGSDRPSPTVGTETANPPPILKHESQQEALERIRDALEEVRPPEWQVRIWEDDATGSMVVELQDEAGETIKQFPPEKILNLRRSLADLAGVVLDKAT